VIYLCYDCILLSMNSKNETIDDSASQPLVSEAMAKIRPRSHLIANYRILISPHSLRYLISSCLIAFTCFSIVLYINFAIIKLLFDPPSNIKYHFNFNKKLSANTIIKPARRLNDIDKTIVYKDFNYLNSNSLTYETLNDNTTPILYRFPRQREVIGLLLIFHGCGRSAHDWFHTIERQRIIGSAIDLGFACLAFQATDHIHRCWSNEIDVFQNADIQMVNGALQNFYNEYPRLSNSNNQLFSIGFFFFLLFIQESLSRYTFGASSGGIFSSIYATQSKYPIHGQILFISIVHPDILDINVRHNKYPPTAWIYVGLDKNKTSLYYCFFRISLFR